MRLAPYDLSKMPTTFDFAVTAVLARSLGYDGVHFDVSGMATWKYAAEIGWRRWANILIPLCGLAGLKASAGLGIEGETLGYATGDVDALYRKAGRIAKLSAPEEPDRTGYVTITMRESFRNAWRNSNRAEWERVRSTLVARGEEVIILEDAEDAPMAVGRRLALYEGAKMNLAVGNGPMVLCWLSEAPYASFQLPKPPGCERERAELVAQWDRMGFPVGSQLSFRNERQEIVWGPDDSDLILERFTALTRDDRSRRAA
jgi:hypothetical protein